MTEAATRQTQARNNGARTTCAMRPLRHIAIACRRSPPHGLNRASMPTYPAPFAHLLHAMCVGLVMGLGKFLAPLLMRSSWLPMSAPPARARMVAHANLILPTFHLTATAVRVRRGTLARTAAAQETAAAQPILESKMVRVGAFHKNAARWANTPAMILDKPALRALLDISQRAPAPTRMDPACPQARPASRRWLLYATVPRPGCC